MPVEHNELELRSADGTRLAAQRWRPGSGDARAEVLVVPGYADHAARYRELAHTFAMRGLATLALDLRGHGASEGRRGHVARWSDYAQDVSAGVTALVAKTRFALGHSMGATVMLEYLATDGHGLSGLAVTNPFLELAMKPPGWKLALGKLAANLAPTLAVPSGLDPSEMSRDQEMAEAYRRDPLVFTAATAGWFREVKAAQARVRRITSLAVPVFYAYSDADRVAAPSASEAFAGALEVADKTVWKHEGGRHEIINETDRADVHARLADWFLAHA